MTPSHDFTGTPLFIVEYLRKDTRHGHSYNGTPIGIVCGLSNDDVSNNLK